MHRDFDLCNLRVLLVCICSLLYPASAVCQSQDRKPAVTPRVDERIELLSIVFRLAGNPEYNMNTLPAYSADIDRYFARFKDHSAVKMAQGLLEKNGVAFDAVMSMAISLSPPPELNPLVAFTPEIPDRRWSVANSEKFLPLLRDFFRDSKFADFYAAHQTLYHAAETRFATTLGSVDFGWYSRFYGKAPDLTYHLILGMNNGGGNYGPRLVLADGRVELFSIIGCWTHDDAGNPTYPLDQGYPATIIHEFNHSFVNPAVDEHWNEFLGVEQVNAAVADQMKQMAYGDAKTMVDESLVRAAVIMYFQDTGEDGAKNLGRVRLERRQGFFWMDKLVEKLKQYEKQRAQYPAFSSYVPQVAVFYSNLAALITGKSAHVVGMEPFANHSQDVDPSAQTIKIVVDKPLDPNSYSISYDTGGSEHYPITGKPTFGDGGRQILLPVQLKPNQAYSFVFGSMAFVTLEGYPLARYIVDFKTK